MSRTPAMQSEFPRRSGFTLVEMLVALGAVALMSVGIAQIFSVTGKTVSAGRRLSNLTTYAGVLERQFRSDLGAITRDGFLLIRNEIANRGAAVGLSPDDPAPHPRRVDEIAFFTQGRYTTNADPVSPGRTARATAARVYYGHGLQRDPVDPAYVAPVRLDDDNRQAFGFGVTPTGGARNPNQYAANWILMRHVLLLQAPSNAVPDKSQGSPIVPPNEMDNAAQIDVQPAVMDIFRARALSARLPAAGALYRGSVRPILASGAIDIASTDLGKIRAVVLGAQKTAPYAITNGFPLQGEAPFDAMQRMQSWMIDSLPADSDNGRRMRCEPAAPNLLGIGWNNPQDYQKSDQAMLAASSFLPRCTEFVVEWSFGQVQDDPAYTNELGRVIWYGLNRGVDADGNGTPEYRIRPYSDSASPQHYQVALARNGGAFQWPVNKNLVNARAVGTAPTDPLYSFFGYVDPLWAPPTTGTYYSTAIPAITTDINGNSQYDAMGGDALLFPDTIPWAWPRMIRLTVTLADPEDVTIERTFQFIFTLPAQTTGAPL